MIQRLTARWRQPCAASSVTNTRVHAICAHIARQEPHLYDGLYSLLLETIARDSEKHATVLRYLLQRVEDRAR